MLQYETVEYLQRSEMMLQSPEMFEPESLAQEITAKVYLGVNDHITCLV